MLFALVVAISCLGVLTGAQCKKCLGTPIFRSDAPHRISLHLCPCCLRRRSRRPASSGYRGTRCRPRYTNTCGSPASRYHHRPHPSWWRLSCTRKDRRSCPVGILLSNGSLFTRVSHETLSIKISARVGFGRYNTPSEGARPSSVGILPPLLKVLPA